MLFDILSCNFNKNYSMKKSALIGKLLPKEWRDKPEVKAGLATIAISGGAYALNDIINGKITLGSAIAGIFAIASIWEGIEDVKEVIDESKE